MSKYISQYGVQQKRNILVSDLISMGIKFPNIQRDIIEEHVKEMIDFQRDFFSKKGFYFFPNCLIFAHFRDNYYCIDGQHRYFTMEVLKKDNNDYDWGVDIEIIECISELEMISYFQTINKNHPVPEFLKKIEDVDNAERIKCFKNYIEKNYGAYISKSNKPHRPNINLDIFINEMDKKYKLSDFETFNDLVKWFENENDIHKNTLENQYKGLEGVSKALEKIREGTRTRNGKKLYLGSYWLDKPKNELSTQTRRKLWKIWYSNQPTDAKSPCGEILCPCCEETFISSFNFEAGHIRSFKNGGTDELDNLRPVCGTCNRLMGIMNYDDYKKTLV